MEGQYLKKLENYLRLNGFCAGRRISNQKKKFRNAVKALFMVMFSLILFLLTYSGASAAEIVVTGSIQTAINQAQPGDSIFVPPGIYRENVVVNKNDLSIYGSRGVVLDGEGLTGSTGIRVAPPTTATRINGFRLSGLTIRNYRQFGVFLIRVDNYAISDGVYQNNQLYGIYPVRSTNGLVEGNHASGSVDSGIYIGQSDMVIIRNNICFDNTTGIEIENATRIEAKANLVRNNSVGISVFVLPGRSIPKTEDVLVQNNTIINNNRPNTVTNPNEIISRLPAGSGILIIGADRVEVRNNRVVNNDSTGAAVIRLPAELAALDPRVNPFPDNNLITDNTVLQNGKNPDPRLGSLPPADFDWDLTGTGNHWENNRYQTSFPFVLP